MTSETSFHGNCLTCTKSVPKISNRCRKLRQEENAVCSISHVNDKSSNKMLAVTVTKYSAPFIWIDCLVVSSVCLAEIADWSAHAIHVESRLLFQAVVKQGQINNQMYRHLGKLIKFKSFLTESGSFELFQVLNVLKTSIFAGWFTWALRVLLFADYATEKAYQMTKFASLIYCMSRGTEDLIAMRGNLILRLQFASNLWSRGMNKPLQQ